MLKYYFTHNQGQDQGETSKISMDPNRVSLLKFYTLVLMLKQTLGGCRTLPSCTEPHRNAQNTHFKHLPKFMCVMSHILHNCNYNFLADFRQSSFYHFTITYKPRSFWIPLPQIIFIFFQIKISTLLWYSCIS